ncbi:uncharacterized protein LOC143244286 isoform X3 [Tachypleus tridentatus]|uniref:uncharacterized protein LOC143244286 isoform X3 n=1 Tax=Tachypleus tridentatus TaxID=6853 RepID=UPI003FD5436E
MSIETGGRSGTKNPIKIIANIFISFIGAGVLGLPFAFKESGVLEGVIIMLAVSVFSIKAMLLLIKCKYKILENQATSKVTAFSKFEKLNLSDSLATKIDQEEMKVLLNSENHELELSEMSNRNEEESIKDLNYGDLGQHAMGNIGRWLVDMTILVSQLGFCCAYLIFISENLSSYISRVSNATFSLCRISPGSCCLPGYTYSKLSRYNRSIHIICRNSTCSHCEMDVQQDHVRPQWLIILLPPLFLLTLLRHLHKLALFRFHPKEFSLKGFPFFFAMAIYCYEGAGMILSLEASCLKEIRHLFNRYFIITISFSTALYIAFGVSGYMNILEHSINVLEHSRIFLSTLHREPSIDDESGKPEIISYCNSTKGGVDTLDQIVRFLSTNRKTRRWPMALFYNILDAAAYNAYLLYRQRHPEFTSKYQKRARREFLKLLTDELLPEEDTNEVIPPKDQKVAEENVRKWCQICARDSRKKTSSKCIKCSKMACNDHKVTQSVCINCIE